MVPVQGEAHRAGQLDPAQVFRQRLPDDLAHLRHIGDRPGRYQSHHHDNDPEACEDPPL